MTIIEYNCVNKCLYSFHSIEYKKKLNSKSMTKILIT